MFVRFPFGTLWRNLSSISFYLTCGVTACVSVCEIIESSSWDTFVSVFPPKSGSIACWLGIKPTTCPVYNSTLVLCCATTGLTSYGKLYHIFFTWTNMLCRIKMAENVIKLDISITIKLGFVFRRTSRHSDCYTAYSKVAKLIYSNVD